MARNFNIKTLTQGNDVVLRFNITTTVDLALALFTVKRKASNPDASIVIDKSVTTSETADGQITDATLPSAVVQIVLTKSDTAALLGGVDYVWDLEVFDADDKATTPVGGIINVAERVRTATG